MGVSRRGWATVAATAGTMMLGIGAIVAGVAVSSRAADAREASGAARMARGVQVAGLDVGDLTREEAAERVKTWARAAMSRPVTLVAPRSGRRWNLALYDAGGRFDVDGALTDAWEVGRDANAFERLVAQIRGARYDVRIEPAFHLNESTLREQVEKIARTVRVPARNARAKRDEIGILTVTEPERKGVRVDVDATVAALLKNGEAALKTGGTGKLVIAEERPAVTAEDLGDVSYQLGSYSTYYGSSSSNRRHNVELAASHIDGTLLGPGEVFSYNDVVGPRTRRTGWRTAPQYQDGQVVDGIGGGVCQVSTTLYNAALLSNVKIVRRSNHSMPVKYVRPGRDATVSYDAIDLQFRNNTNASVYVEARARGGRLTMSLYGKEPSPKPQVEIVSGRTRPRTDGGFVVTTYRVVTASGETRREMLSTDSYRPHAPGH